jgi:hypothetical protein
MTHVELALLLLVTEACLSCGTAEQVSDESSSRGPRALTQTNSCPAFEWWLLLPKSLPLGENTEIVVNVSDPETPSSKLRFDWASPSGAFSDPLLADTTYTCLSLGRQVLTLSARDELDCTSVLELDVHCFEP